MAAEERERSVQEEGREVRRKRELKGKRERKGVKGRGRGRESAFRANSRRASAAAESRGAFTGEIPPSEIILLKKTRQLCIFSAPSSTSVSTNLPLHFLQHISFSFRFIFSKNYIRFASRKFNDNLNFCEK